MEKNKRRMLKYVKGAIYLLSKVQELAVDVGDGDISEPYINAAIEIDQLALVRRV